MFLRTLKKIMNIKIAPSVPVQKIGQDYKTVKLNRLKLITQKEESLKSV